MEDDPSWFQLAASGSTTDISEIQAALRGLEPVADYSQPTQPFVAFAVDEALSSALTGNRISRRKDEEATGHDHVLWFNRKGKLSRSVLKVSGSTHSVLLASVCNQIAHAGVISEAS